MVDKQHNTYNHRKSSHPETRLHFHRYLLAIHTKALPALDMPCLRLNLEDLPREIVWTLGQTSDLHNSVPSKRSTCVVER
jgi:hypothetical protein